MELKDILAKCAHTLLAPTATWAEIKAICDDGMKYKTASVCIPASFVKQAKEYVGENLAICTVIGFPNGYATTAAKCFMASTLWITAQTRWIWSSTSAGPRRGSGQISPTKSPKSRPPARENC